MAVGSRVGLGKLIGACHECTRCLSGKEQWCSNKRLLCATVEGKVGEHGGEGDTDANAKARHGGLRDRFRVDARHACVLPEGMDSEMAAPLLTSGVRVCMRWHTSSPRLASPHISSHTAPLTATPQASSPTMLCVTSKQSLVIASVSTV